MMRNLVIGSEGFVGKSLCRFLTHLGEEVVRFDIKLSPAQDARLAKLPLQEIDRVYFLAWDVGGAKYLYRNETQNSQLLWNLQLLLNAMPQLQEKNLPFLFVSSQLSEQCDTVYGVTKRLGETWTRLLGGTLVRLWNVYGPVESETERSHVVSDFAVQAISTGQIKMLTSGEEIRQFIHIDDVCRACHLAISNRLSGVYDVSSFEWMRVLDLAQIIARLTDARVVPGTAAGSSPFTAMKGRIPGWLPRVSIEEGLLRLVDDVRKGIASANEIAIADVR